MNTLKEYVIVHVLLEYLRIAVVGKTWRSIILLQASYTDEYFIT